MKKVILRTWLIFWGLLFLSACVTGQLPPSAKEPLPVQEAKLRQATAAQLWEQEWKNLVTAARKEGQIIVYTSSGPRVREGLAPRLFEKYGIQMELISGKAAEIIQKITMERRAGLYLPDLYIGGSGPMVTDLKPKEYLDPLEPLLLLPEVKTPTVWEGNQLRFIDKDRMILSFTAYPSAPLGINTNLVQPNEIKSYKDLLAPRWKGKLLMNDPTTAGAASKWFGVVSIKIMGLDFMRQLVKQEPRIIRDLRIQLEWLAQGKYPVLISPHTATMKEFTEAGASIMEFTPIEGTYLTAGSGNVVLINRAPHPKAARLFINWLLTKEAGLLWQKAMGQQSARLDVPPEFLEPGRMRQKGIKYIIGDDEEFLLKEPEQIQTAKEIFGHLMK